jgi:hypothetical protein
MTTTPSTLARRVVALAAAPVLLLGLAACGDDDDDASGFCDDARSVDEQMTDLDIESGNLADIAAAMDDIEPPSEIADDWDAMVEGFQALSEADLEDPAAFEDPAIQEADEASQRVGTYLQEECDIDVE